MNDSGSQSTPEQGEEMNCVEKFNGEAFNYGEPSSSSINANPTTCSNCMTSFNGEKTWHNAEAWAIEQKLALMAGKAAFDLEGYIFRQVLPATDIKPYIFPRTVDEMESYIVNCTTKDEREDMMLARAKWNGLRNEINWTVVHEQVLSSVKQSYLMIKPPADMVKEINAKRRNMNDLIRAFRTSLPIHLRPAGDEIVQIMMQLNLV